MLRRGVVLCCLRSGTRMQRLLCAAAFYRCVSMRTPRLQNQWSPQGDACKWSTLRRPLVIFLVLRPTGACAHRECGLASGSTH
jgi:hypothetical protein